MDDCIETRLPYERRWENGKRISMHRWTWEQANGPIPEGQVVMHICDNTKCINLAHLKLGTRSDNLQDMSRKARGYGSLPVDEREEIISLLQEGGYTLRYIASLYGINHTTVLRIRKVYVDGVPINELYPSRKKGGAK